MLCLCHGILCSTKRYGRSIYTDMETCLRHVKSDYQILADLPKTAQVWWDRYEKIMKNI